MTKYFQVLLTTLIFIFSLPYNIIAQQKKTPKNVIIMIADGCGFNHILATDYYQFGKEGEQVYEKFPVRLAVSTYPAKIGSYPDKLSWATGYNPFMAWQSYDYLRQYFTESAAAATALATGVKTYNNSIGMDLNYKKIKNLSETAIELKKSAGVISSVQFSHATPAGFSAHNIKRSNYSEIAKEMILDSKLTVIMGTGNPYYNNDGVRLETPKDFRFIGDSLTWEYLKKGSKEFIFQDNNNIVEDIDFDNVPDAWKLIETKEDFEKLSKRTTPKRVIGVPQVFSNLQQERSGNTDKAPFEVPLTKTVPDLKTMTLAALNVLDNNHEGLFLMVEGGSVDQAAHGNQTGRMIEEMIDFNKAVEGTVEWVEKYSNWDETLVIVTADHETGLIWGPEKDSSKKYFNPIINNGKGKLPLIQWNTKSHSNSLVPFFAKGPGMNIFESFADETDPVRGRFINNTEIPQAVRFLWNK